MRFETAMFQAAHGSEYRSQRVKPYEFGGSDGTDEITQGVLEKLASSG